MARFFLFGTPRLEHNGQIVPLRRTKALALLAYIAATGRPQDRDTLIALLWPEFDAASARNNLRRELSLLKTALDEEILVADRLQVARNPQVELWLDVAAFQEQITIWKQHGHAAGELCAGCAAALAAVARLGADEFMAGFSVPDCPAFDEWQFFQREGLRQQLAEALQALIGWYCGTEEYGAAIEHGRRWLALDGLHEPAQRQLMRLYAWAGQQSAALRQYEECARLLDNELGIEPEAETTELFEAIKARRLARPSTPSAQAPAETRPVERSLPASQLRPPALTPPLAGFVGRQRELAEILGRLTGSSCRLLTLTGPGGIGKTRLALCAAAEAERAFPDGVVVVPLAVLVEPALVIPTIAHTLGISEDGCAPLLERLNEHLHDRRLLLVLDNFEQVAAAGPQIGALLASTVHLRVLVTSRAVLRVYEEQVYPVPPLDLPHAARQLPPACLEQYESVKLFVARAQAVRPDFRLTDEYAPVVAEICRRLDGLPLAIELAAARMKLLSPPALIARLDRALPVLTGGACDLPARHQTLRNTLAWSYDLLAPAEQRLFRQMAVFAGGGTLEAIEAVCLSDAGRSEGVEALDWLESLADKSLLQYPPLADEPRFSMLATIREYAAERLAAGDEAAAARQRYIRYFLELVERAEPELVGPRQQAWFTRLAAEHDNLRAVLGQALARGDSRTALRMVAALWRFWWIQGHLREGRRWLAEALAQPTADDPALTFARAKALQGAGALARQQGDLVAAQAAFAESLTLYRTLGDKQGIADMLNSLGLVTKHQGDYTTTRWFFEESLALRRELDDRSGIAKSLNNLGLLAEHVGDYAAARACYEESLAIKRELGDSWGIASTLGNLAIVAGQQGDYAGAYSRHQASLSIKWKLGNTHGIAESLEGLAAIVLATGEIDRAVRLFGAAEGQFNALQVPRPPADQAALERTLGHARARLDAAAFEAEWAVGRGMPIEEAIALALQGAAETK